MATIISLDRLGHILPLGDTKDMSRLQVFDVDPETNPIAKGIDLAALFRDHHELIESQEEAPPLGRPVYFVRTRGSGNVILRPHCDKAYWFRAEFRAPIKYGAAPKAEQ